jgi:hypothetical protein
MSTGHRLLQELQHVLQYLDAGIEQVDALWDLEITSCCVVKRSQIRERLGDGSSVVGEASRSVVLAQTLTQNTSGESRTEPTAVMLARRRKTSPILRMISSEKIDR